MDDLLMERRMTIVESWQANHERLCADRFLALRQDIRWVLGGVAAVVAAIMGWMALELWHQVQPPPRPVPIEARR